MHIGGTFTDVIALGNSGRLVAPRPPPCARTSNSLLWQRQPLAQRDFGLFSNHGFKLQLSTGAPR
jgi:hypothetical protein